MRTFVLAFFAALVITACSNPTPSNESPANMNTVQTGQDVQVTDSASAVSVDSANAQSLTGEQHAEDEKGEKDND